MASARDPRTDPRAGDMLLMRVGDSCFGVYVISAYCGYVAHKVEGISRSMPVSSEAWKDCMRTADVLRAAEFSDHG